MRTPAGRRVAVTGLGMVTPLGNDVAANWEALLAGRSGIGPISRFNAAALPVRIAGELRGFDPESFLERKEVKRMDPFIQYAVAAAQMAMDDADLRLEPSEAERAGVIMGVGMGGMSTIEQTARTYHETGSERVGPFFIPRLSANMAPAHIAIRFGAKGENHAVSSACASGADAIGSAARLIRFGYHDVMLAGGAEASVTFMCVSGFAAMRALSRRNDEPERASRPFDRERDGFVVAEGAALLVLEALDHARARGARVYAELAGYGATADAYHITAPAPDGGGAARSMRRALEDAGLEPLDVGYVNAHGSATPHNDIQETQAIKRVFGEGAARLAISSTKSMTGHALGAAGAIEAAYTVLALHHQTMPPTVNYDHPDPACDLDYVPNTPRSGHFGAALSNSFGFGGANACLAFRAASD